MYRKISLQCATDYGIGVSVLSTLSIIFPIFALVFSGWALCRSGIVSEHATTEMNKFVVFLALPALLFDIIANSNWETLWQPDFILCLSLSTFGLMAVVYTLQCYRKKPAANSAMLAINASYANNGFMGFPLMLSIFGDSALTPTLIATIITVCVHFAVGMILVEVGLQAKAHPVKLFRIVGFRVIKNPLILAPLVASIFPSFELAVPSSAQTFLDLLGSAAAPCALITVGLFLGSQPRGQKVINSTIALLTSLKLIVHPLITWLLAFYVFEFSVFTTYCLVLLTALPTGTGPFMLAKFYNLEPTTTSGTILLSTALSPITLIILLTAFPPPIIV